MDCFHILDEWNVLRFWPVFYHIKQKYFLLALEKVEWDILYWFRVDVDTFEVAGDQAPWYIFGFISNSKTILEEI